MKVSCEITLRPQSPISKVAAQWLRSKLAPTGQYSENEHFYWTKPEPNRHWKVTVPRIRSALPRGPQFSSQIGSLGPGEKPMTGKNRVSFEVDTNFASLFWPVEFRSVQRAVLNTATSLPAARRGWSRGLTDDRGPVAGLLVRRNSILLTKFGTRIMKLLWPPEKVEKLNCVRGLI